MPECSTSCSSRKSISTTTPDKEYAETVNKGTNKCFVCHQGKKSKKNRNPFGQEVLKLLDAKKNIKDTDKIVDALKKAVAMHVDPKDEKSETYLDRITASKWPGGELENLQAGAGKERG